MPEARLSFTTSTVATPGAPACIRISTSTAAFPLGPSYQLRPRTVHTTYAVLDSSDSTVSRLRGRSWTVAQIPNHTLDSRRMMHKSIDGVIDSLPSMQVSDMMRGRTRHRCHNRDSAPNSERADESSTLRGRSRQRALSPRGSASRNQSPSLLSPTRHLALSNRFRDSRREHCPSRATSPSGRKASLRVRNRGNRSRSSSRGPRAEGHRTVDSQSSLRHEVFAEEAAYTNDDGHHEQDT